LPANSLRRCQRRCRAKGRNRSRQPLRRSGPRAAQSGTQREATGLPQSATAAVGPIAGQQGLQIQRQRSRRLSAQPQVRPALPSAAQTASASSAATGCSSGRSPHGSNCAAVSHEEDADVLVGALRKHGCVEHGADPARTISSTWHGPCNDRDEANR